MGQMSLVFDGMERAETDIHRTPRKSRRTNVLSDDELDDAARLVARSLGVLARERAGHERLMERSERVGRHGRVRTRRRAERHG